MYELTDGTENKDEDEEDQPQARQKMKLDQLIELEDRHRKAVTGKSHKEMNTLPPRPQSRIELSVGT